MFRNNATNPLTTDAPRASQDMQRAALREQLKMAGHGEAATLVESKQFQDAYSRMDSGVAFDYAHRAIAAYAEHPGVIEPAFVNRIAILDEGVAAAYLAAAIPNDFRLTPEEFGALSDAKYFQQFERLSRAQALAELDRAQIRGRVAHAAPVLDAFERGIPAKQGGEEERRHIAAAYEWAARRMGDPRARSKFLAPEFVDAVAALHERSPATENAYRALLLGCEPSHAERFATPEFASALGSLGEPTARELLSCFSPGDSGEKLGALTSPQFLRALARAVPGELLSPYLDEFTCAEPNVDILADRDLFKALALLPRGIPLLPSDAASARPRGFFFLLPIAEAGALASMKSSREKARLTRAFDRVIYPATGQTLPDAGGVASALELGVRRERPRRGAFGAVHAASHAAGNALRNAWDGAARAAASAHAAIPGPVRDAAAFLVSLPVGACLVAAAFAGMIYGWGQRRVDDLLTSFDRFFGHRED